MAVFYNSIEIKNPVFNETKLDNIYFNGINVFKRGPTIEHSVLRNVLSPDMSEVVTASTENYALFAGGLEIIANKATDFVDVFDKSLVWSYVFLSTPRSEFAGTTVGEHLIFAGGVNVTKVSPYRTSLSSVDAFNSSLTLSTPTILPEPVFRLAAAKTENYALFAGGDADQMLLPDYNNSRATVTAFNSTLTQSTPTSLSAYRKRIHGTSAGSNALFLGGDEKGPLSIVDAYKDSLVRSNPQALTNRYSDGAGSTATHVGEYAIICGGEDKSYARNSTVEVYNSSLVRCTSISQSLTRNCCMSSSLKGQALIAGGTAVVNSVAGHTDVVDCFNTSLVRSQVSPLSEPMRIYNQATVGDYILFGPYTPVNYTYPYWSYNNLEVYKIT